MSTFTLAISCLTTSNLPSWTWHSRFLCNIAFYSIGPCFYHLSHPQLGIIFALAQPIHSVELFFCSSPVAYWAPTDLGSSSFSVYLFAFSYCSWGSQGKNTEVACHSLLQWTTICRTSPPWPAFLGLPHRHGLVSLSKTRLWSMWSDRLFFCDCGFQSACPLMEKDKRVMEVS